MAGRMNMTKFAVFGSMIPSCKVFISSSELDYSLAPTDSETSLLALQLEACGFPIKLNFFDYHKNELLQGLTVWQ